MKIVGVVQARVGSTRLPGKVLLPAGGRPLLERMLARLAKARELDEIVVATTTAAVDRSILTLAAGSGVRAVAGHATDLIDRHLQAARVTGADAIVKIPSDCPLIDPAIVDRVVAAFRAAAGQLDYVGNLRPPTWPDGNDVEVMGRAALEAAFREADRAYEREHTTPFIWDQPRRFRLANVRWASGRDLSATHRLTLDYPADYEVIRAVFEALERGPLHPPFTVGDAAAFLDAHPELRERNAAHRGPGWLSAHLHELRTPMGAAAATADVSDVNDDLAAPAPAPSPALAARPVEKRGAL